MEYFEYLDISGHIICNYPRLRCSQRMVKGQKMVKSFGEWMLWVLLHPPLRLVLDFVWFLAQYSAVNFVIGAFGIVANSQNVSKL